MIPPRGFRAELFPLRHRFNYGFGLNGVTATLNSSIATIVKGSADTAMNNPNTIEVNPHNATFAEETGALCHQMSILEKIKISIRITLTEQARLDGVDSATVKYMPIFCSFPEKLASTDDRTGFTAASVLELVGDATNDDVIPLYAVKTPTVASASAVAHPMSTVNDTEVFGDMGLTTNTAMETVAWDNTLFFQAVKFFTNKGAIRSMVGKQRSVHLTSNRPTKQIFIDKFVPRAVRRVVSHSYFGMLFHYPLDSEPDQNFYSGAFSTPTPQIGIKMNVSFHEWNADHIQDVET